MIAFAIVIFLLAVLTAVGLGVAMWQIHRRGQAARHQLAQDSHDRALALDRRFDAMEARQGQLEQRQTLDHLAALVARGEHEGRWNAATSETLKSYVADLYGELEESEHP